MISFDTTYKQILSNACFNCCDAYFQPANPMLPKVGCCSYSPNFTLFELNACLKNNDEVFLREKIFANTNATIHDYEVIVHANVNEAFFTHDVSSLSKIEVDDLKLSYSICQFFKEGAGCQLHPSYKNATCRSFICLAVEQVLSDIEQRSLSEAIKNIQEEAKAFNRYYTSLFQRKGWNFHNHLDKIIAYFSKKNKIIL